MLMPWTLAPADVSQRSATSDQRYSCSLGVVAVRRLSHRPGGLGVGRILLKHLGGLPLACTLWGFPWHAPFGASLGMHDPKPMKSKTSSRIWDSPKNSVILASAMTQSGVLGKR